MAAALLVIDMQNDFILPGGPMHVAGAEAIVLNVIRAVSVARERGFLVIWVVREHDPWGRDVELFRRHLYASGNGPTTVGTKGAELVDGLLPKEGEYKLVKTRFSAFFDTHLNSLLQSNGIKSLVVVGVQTPNCIRQTVFDAVASNYQPVTVIVDATAAKTPEVHAGESSSVISNMIFIPHFHLLLHLLKLSKFYVLYFQSIRQCMPKYSEYFAIGNCLEKYKPQ